MEGEARWGYCGSARVYENTMMIAYLIGQGGQPHPLPVCGLDLVQHKRRLITRYSIHFHHLPKCIVHAATASP